MPVTTGKFQSKAKVVKFKTGEDHTPEECPHKLNGKYIHYKPINATEGKEMIKTFDIDGARMLIVPNRQPLDTPAIIGQSEFERLSKQAHVVTPEDKRKMVEEAEKEKHRLVAESTQRKDELFRSHKTQNNGAGTKQNADSDAANKNLYLLTRSQEMQLEEDEQIKQANAIILATKCRAIRNAQIAEKRLIEKALKDEEQRLDNMMEQRRQQLMQNEEDKREACEKKKQRYVKEVQQQMRENELQRLLEAEAIEEESRMINKALIELQKEEEAKMQTLLEQKQQMREHFKKANEEADHYRAMKAEEQRISDLRIQEFMRQKAEREDQIEREKMMIKVAKEKEIQRMREMQERGQDLQAQLDEMNAMRAQEEKEKEWRENERQKALKKKTMIEDLRASRSKQIEDIRKTQARQLAKDQEDFFKVAKVQQELHQKEQEKVAKKRQNNEKHKKELLKQINEKERERIYWQTDRFEEGKMQRVEMELKAQEAEQYLKMKVNKLRESNMPEPYIKDIERQLKLAKLSS